MLILTYPCNVPLNVFYIEIEFIVPHTFTGVIVIPLSADDEFSPYVPSMSNSLLFPNSTVEIIFVESLTGISP